MTTASLRYDINLLPDGSVVTRDGEYLGTWAIDEETDAFHEFTPEGASKRLFSHPFVPEFCDRIAEWHRARDAG